MRLADDIIPQQQPTDDSCVPTSVAMAMGKPVKEVLAEMRNMGLYREGVGCWDSQIQYYLMHYKVACSQLLCQEGMALNYGHYLASVPSLNFIGRCHTILMHVFDDVDGQTCVTVYDPNNNREDKKFYDFDAFADVPVTYFTFLNDFRGIDKYGSLNIPDGECDHSHWEFKKHGRVCTCGTIMIDFGD